MVPFPRRFGRASAISSLALLWFLASAGEACGKSDLPPPFSIDGFRVELEIVEQSIPSSHLGQDSFLSTTTRAVCEYVGGAVLGEVERPEAREGFSLAADGGSPILAHDKVANAEGLISRGLNDGQDSILLFADPFLAVREFYHPPQGEVVEAQRDGNGAAVGLTRTIRTPMHGGDIHESIIELMPPNPSRPGVVEVVAGFDSPIKPGHLCLSRTITYENLKEWDGGRLVIPETITLTEFASDCRDRPQGRIVFRVLSASSITDSYATALRRWESRFEVVLQPGEEFVAASGKVAVRSPLTGVRRYRDSSPWTSPWVMIVIVAIIGGALTFLQRRRRLVQAG